MAGTTYCTFGTTLYSKGFDFTFGPGVYPSVCMLYTVPHVPSLSQVGTLTFRTEGQPPFEFRDCLNDKPRLAYTKSGQRWVLPVKDRRWKWQWGNAYGWYNKPEPNGTYTREKTPRELATILFDILGETGYDVSRLPNTTRPEARWDGAPAAAELDALCDALGCIVVLNPLTDKAEVWPVGTGSTLPNDGTIGSTYAPVYPGQPSSIKVEAGETIFQATFRMQAVGVDVDDSVKPIDNLSFKPPGGWNPRMALTGFQDFDDFQVYNSGGRILKIRDLAAAHVYRSFRATGIVDGGWSPPILTGTPLQPQSLKDLQLFSELADEEISGFDGGLRRLPAAAYCRWERVNQTTPIQITRYPDAFGMDTETGVITFGEPMFLWDNGGIPAEVRLECAFYAGANGVFHKRSVEVSTGAPSTTPSRLIQHPEIQARNTFRFDNLGNRVAVSDSFADTDTKLNYWKDAALAEYGLQNGGTVPYEGLRRFSPDGLIEQITWSGGDKRPATTVVSAAQRHNRFTKPLEEYRDRLQAKRQENALLQIATRGLVRAIGGGL